MRNPHLTFGLTATIISILGLLFLFSNVILIELNYQLNKFNPNRYKTEIKLPVIPVDKNFSIIIPKININAKVLPNIDPFNTDEYLEALKKGVAHAKGTSFPNELGNIFIFAHSTTADLIEVNRYNAIFYLLGKLNKDDIIYLSFQGKNYKYQVYKIKIADSNDVKFLTAQTDNQTLTLMTCWPPGTTLKRLLILASKL